MPASEKKRSKGVAVAQRQPAHVASAAPAARPHGIFGPQTLLAGVALVTALYFGREVFVPIALAVLLTFLLSPIVSLLRRWRIPRTIAVITVVAMAMFAIFVFGVVVANQVSNLASNLSSYQYNIQNKIRDFKNMEMAQGSFDRAARMLEALEKEIQESREEAGTAEEEEPDPLPVRIEEAELAPLEMLQSIITPLVEPLATGGIVIVFVIFMLLRREDLRDRFIRLVGAADLHRTTNALQDAGRRVAQYLMMQLIVNVTYAVPISFGLWVIGVPNALLWGLLCLVLRFVPYVGPVIAAFFPLALSVAVDPGWTMLLWTAALIITLELISNNLIEPWLYGSRTGLSPVAIILAAIFWTWLWGPIGLLLSTPLTVCFVVLGRHVPQFEFLDILLGNEPVLAPHERLYQRLLAGDPDEATEQAELFLKDRPIREFYDEVALPALVLVEFDRVRGVLDEHQREMVASGAEELVENLEEHEDVEPEEADADAAEDVGEERRERKAGRLAAPTIRPGKVVCAGARGNLDDAAAVMLCDALQHAHVPALALPHEMMQATQLRSFDFTDVQTVIVGYLNTESIAHARYLVRRLRRTKEEMTVIIAFWGMEGKREELEKLIEAIGSDSVVTTINELVDVLEPIAATDPEAARKEQAAHTESHGPMAAPQPAG
ncbi:AI-2E family transporter [Pararhizobium haloflavum]|uniref:AI-2E family transporter n=1 Tax=Pararhizobium haloflavum TaxID=2037914 RepID=UPI000C1743F9|nr:AI-2E family transporter [Pararhizobium haloflavum]